MRVYINNILVSIGDQPQLLTSFQVVRNRENVHALPHKLKGKALIVAPSHEAVYQLLKTMIEKKHKRIKRIHLQVENKKKTAAYLKSKFKVVKAAGGVVEKEGKVLMILRRGFWDLPKGKKEKGEKNKHCAIREVEEETGVRVQLGHKLCATWHTYVRNKKYILKKTAWYRMNCLSDTQMTPQKEEDIEKTVWMNAKEVDLALAHAYPAIKKVVACYRKAND